MIHSEPSLMSQDVSMDHARGFHHSHSEGGDMAASTKQMSHSHKPGSFRPMGSEDHRFSQGIIAACKLNVCIYLL